jgi:predicted nucleic acid-binding protein
LTRYFDSSAWVKRYIQEPGTEVTLAWLAASQPATCRLTAVETASALFRRAREGSVTFAQTEAVQESLRDDFESLRIVELTRDISDIAFRLVSTRQLRAADAVQLASALYLRATLPGRLEFIAFDDRLNAAAQAEGLATPAANL